MKLSRLIYIVAACVAPAVAFGASAARPSKTDPTATPPRAVDAAATAPDRQKVDLNTADLKTLASVPSIGPEVANAIVAARPFASVDDLNRLKNVSAEQLELIRTDVMVSTPLAVARPPDRNGAETAKVDLNTADPKILASIPAIGEDGAKAIIAARPFARIDDLDRLPGLSAERLEAIRSQVTVATPQLARPQSKATPSKPAEKPLEPTGRTTTGSRK